MCDKLWLACTYKHAYFGIIHTMVGEYQNKAWNVGNTIYGASIQEFLPLCLSSKTVAVILLIFTSIVNFTCRFVQLIMAVLTLTWLFIISMGACTSGKSFYYNIYKHSQLYVPFISQWQLYLNWHGFSYYQYVSAHSVRTFLLHSRLLFKRYWLKRIIVWLILFQIGIK